MKQETQIDERDGLGEQRAAVFKDVQMSLKFEGERPVNPEFFFGEWVMSYHEPYLTKEPTPTEYRSFFEDSKAPTKAVDGSYNNPKDIWEFHEDKSISLWTYIDPLPEYGIDEPTYEEDRYHALVVTEDKFVLFNGDASITMIYEKFKNTAT